MLDIHIETFQRHPGSDSPGIEMRIRSLASEPVDVFFFSVEGAKKLAAELTDAALCADHGIKYDKDVGWTG